MIQSHVEAQVGGITYNGTFFSSESGINAVVFYAGIPEEGVQALVQRVIETHVHNHTRVVRRDGSVYFYHPLAAA